VRQLIGKFQFALLALGMLLIGAAGLMKALDVPSFLQALGSWSLIPVGLRLPLALTVPYLELGLLLAWLLWPRSSIIPIAAVCILVGFTGVFVAQLLLGSAPDCGCAGILARYIQLEQAGWQVVLRNGLLSIMIILGAMRGRPRVASPLAKNDVAGGAPLASVVSATGG